MSTPAPSPALNPTEKPEQKPGEKPWYRQFWPWFIIALPASSVIAGLSLVFIAISGQDSVVRDDWYKDGRSINVDVARDTLAKTMGLSADIIIDALTGDITASLQSKPGTVLPAQLTLGLFHVTLAKLDQTLTLKKLALKKQGDATYHGTLKQALQGEFDLELAGDNWRLIDSKKFPQEKLHLEPR